MELFSSPLLSFNLLKLNLGEMESKITSPLSNYSFVKKAIIPLTAPISLFFISFFSFLFFSPSPPLPTMDERNKIA